MTLEPCNCPACRGPCRDPNHRPDLEIVLPDGRLARPKVPTHKPVDRTVPEVPR